MSSRVLPLFLVAGCVGAAAAGGYLAVRQNAAPASPAAAATAPTPAPPTAGAPVSETEALVNGASAKPQTDPPAEAPAPAPSAPPKADTARTSAPTVRHQTPAPAPVAPRTRQVTAPSSTPQPATTAVTAERQATPAPGTPVAEQVPELPRADPPSPRVPQFEEVVLPVASVMGLEVDTALSSERARVEDRVDARVTRDVVADGRVAIPAGSRVIGSVTLVERGGKIKQPARLGVRFHTLVLADGREISLRTEPVYREGESPAPESARKIGGAAVGGAILGAIIGGGKGAIIGGATGAAGGSAVVMAGDRNAATLAAGTVVTVRLSAPATLEVEKRDR